MGAVFSNTTSSIHHRADLRTPCAAMIQKDEVRDILPVFSDRPASPGPARTRFVVSLQNSLVLHSLEGRTCAGPHPCARSLRIHGASRDRISIPNSKAVGALKVALYVAGTVFPTGEEPVRNQLPFIRASFRACTSRPDPDPGFVRPVLASSAIRYSVLQGHSRATSPPNCPTFFSALRDW